MLSNIEMDRNLNDRKAKILIFSWNTGNLKKIPSNLDNLISPEITQTFPDIYIIGVQEFSLNE